MNTSPIFGLSTDVVILVLNELSVIDLATLSQTCAFLHALVNEFGWAGYQRRNSRPSMSLCRSRGAWSVLHSVRYDFITDKAFAKAEFIARPLSAPWLGKKQSLLAINSSRLIVAAGDIIYSYTYELSESTNAPPIVFEGSYSFPSANDEAKCATALTFNSDGTLHVGFQDGTAGQIEILGHSEFSTNTTRILEVESAIEALQLSPRDFVQSLSSSHGTMLSLSANGKASLDASFSSNSTIDFEVRSWASHLRMDAPSPFAAIGTSSLLPLAIHPITNDQLSPHPSAVLHLNESLRSSSAVYGICSGAPAPWGASPGIIVSGWYNGTVAIHDLRSSFRRRADGHPLSPLRPSLTLSASYSDEPIYSVSSGGGSGAHVAAGSARHSLVSLWDVRAPRAGFSVHAPLNDPSPVYSLILESSRLFGVTQSRPFVFDFGSGVSESTYPSVPRPTNGTPHKNPANPAGFYVTKFRHHVAGLGV